MRLKKTKDTLIISAIAFISGWGGTAPYGADFARLDSKQEFRLPLFIRRAETALLKTRTFSAPANECPLISVSLILKSAELILFRTHSRIFP